MVGRGLKLEVGCDVLRHSLGLIASPQSATSADGTVQMSDRSGARTVPPSLAPFS